MDRIPLPPKKRSTYRSHECTVSHKCIVTNDQLRIQRDLKNTLDEIEKGLKEVENLIEKNKKKKVSFAVPLRKPRTGKFYDLGKKINWEEAHKMAKINKWLAAAKIDEKKLDAEIKDCKCLNIKMLFLKESLAKAIIERKRLVELRNHVAFLAGQRRSYIPERISYIPYYGKLTF